MSDSEMTTDPFTGKPIQMVDHLIDRLRGHYAVGPRLANGQPEMGWRQTPQIPIQLEAAARIAELEAAIREIDAVHVNWKGGEFCSELGIDFEVVPGHLTVELDTGHLVHVPDSEELPTHWFEGAETQPADLRDIAADRTQPEQKERNL